MVTTLDGLTVYGTHRCPTTEKVLTVTATPDGGDAVAVWGEWRGEPNLLVAVTHIDTKPEVRWSGGWDADQDEWHASIEAAAIDVYRRATATVSNG